MGANLCFLERGLSSEDLSGLLLLFLAGVPGRPSNGWGFPLVVGCEEEPGHREVGQVQGGLPRAWPDRSQVCVELSPMGYRRPHLHVHSRQVGVAEGGQAERA